MDVKKAMTFISIFYEAKCFLSDPPATIARLAFGLRESVNDQLETQI